MKKVLYSLFFLLPFGLFGQQSFNMTLLSNWDTTGLAMRYGAEFNDVWGYRHANGTEVAIIGAMEKIFFIDVTIPANPVLIFAHPVKNINGTVNGSLWRDFKTYQHYAYACADEGNSGLLIFDLSQVPTTVTLVHQTASHWGTAHNIYIDEANGRLYAAGTNTQNNGLKILNLAANPENPPQIGAIPLNTLGGGYVHDVHVRNNIVYCSHGSLAKLQMYNMTNLSNISVVGVIDNYPEEGYNHSSWLNEAGDYLVMADETQGSDLKLVDVTDPLNISSDDINTFYSELLGPGAPGASVAHNPFILGDLAYIAYYHDGVQVFDISDPENIEVLAYYDTYENTSYGGYDGCWGVYPYLPSGIILASDQNTGLYVMEIDNELLAIDFLSFQAYRKNEDVFLQWMVMDASYGNSFEIKRSADNGSTFETIGKVKLVDHQNQYSFLDNHAEPDRKYLYRIDFVQLDASRMQSPVRTVKTANTGSMLKVVNPVTNTLLIDILQPVEVLDVNIYDVEGRLLWTHHEDNPRARLEYDIGNLSSGNYILSLMWPGGAESVQIQIVR